MIGKGGWLALAAGLAQVAVPTAPQNLRIVTEFGSCPVGQIDIDGVKCGQFNGNASTIESGPMQLILHMMIDNKWERDWGPVLSSQTLVRQLEVGYIRIYQQQPPAPRMEKRQP